MQNLALFERPISDKAALFIFEIRHAEQWFALIDSNREHLKKWLSWVDEIKSPEDTRRTIDTGRKRRAESGDIAAGIRFEDRIAGIISLDSIDARNGTAEIGYWIGREFEGKGLITQACGILLRHAFEALSLNRVVLQIQPANEKSKAVARRMGFYYEGTLRQVAAHYGQRIDHEVHSLLRNEWIAKQEESGV